MAPDSLGPESNGCLLVVACDGRRAEALAPAQDAESRVMACELLGDFMELRFVPLQPLPRSRQATPGERAAAVGRLADELTAPAPGPARIFFALAILHPSAAAALELVADCARDPVLTALPLYARIFAATDDRDPAADELQPSRPAAVAPDAGPAAPSIVSGTTTLVGRWTRHTLASGLKDYCQWLLDECSVTGQPGLSRPELALLRTKALGQERNLDEPDLLADDQPEADLLADPQPTATPPTVSSPETPAAEPTTYFPPARQRRRWWLRGLMRAIGSVIRQTRGR
jgi:hypothetical protein